MNQPPSTPEREKMIAFIFDRQYPRGKTGRKLGHTQFLETLREQPTHVLEALYKSAEREKERRAKPRREALS